MIQVRPLHRCLRGENERQAWEAMNYTSQAYRTADSQFVIQRHPIESSPPVRCWFVMYWKAELLSSAARASIDDTGIFDAVFPRQRDAVAALQVIAATLE